MRLKHLTIAGYRSIRERFDLDLDDLVTVILGANDHGKTNLLNALLHLNPDHPFDPEGDVNLDCRKRANYFPNIRYVLRLSEDEQAELLNLETVRIRTETIAAFREQLQQAAEEATEAADLAESRFEAAAANVEDLQNPQRESQEGEDEPSGAPATNAPAIADAQREAEELAGAAKEAVEGADLAAKRVDLARAEELKVLAEIQGIENFNLAANAEKAEADAAKTATNAKRAQTRAENARTAAAEALAAHGEGSEEAQKAERDATAAEEQARQLREEVDRRASDAESLRAAADMHGLAQDGELSFDKGNPLPKPPLPTLDDVPETIAFSRVGVEGELELIDTGSFGGAAIIEYLRERLPRVELIKPQESLPDMATPESIREPGNDFMRGIFWYAGLAPDEWNEIFIQTDETRKRVAAANERLNETLRESWSQGSELRFELDHREGEIDLLIDDPAVQATFVRASQRSSGFTHFFALKTMLYARERESGASSFVWLFDDPGIYLHPSGQHDLLQVLETLAQTNQIGYSTHSIFLINKNYPIRHRLLKKNEKGTVIDQKPFTGRWRAAIDALGLALPGTFLFASKVLLVEGDSDPILLNADMQKLIELGELSIDINPLSVISTGDSKHADALIRILLDSSIVPDIALLFDGDKGGIDRRKNLKKLVESKAQPKHELDRGTTLEDHVLSPELYREATIRYLEGSPNAPKTIRDELQASYAEQLGSGKPKMLAKWAREEGKRVLGESEEPSSVGIAREYAALLAEAKPEDLPTASVQKRAIDLARKITEMLKLAPQTVEQEKIVEET